MSKKRGRIEERIKIVVRYRDTDPVMIYNKNKQKLSVYTISNEKIDVKMLPKDLPGREYIGKALETLPAFSDVGVTYKTSIAYDGTDDVVAFLMLPTFLLFVDGIITKWEDAMIHDIFVYILIPNLSFRDVASLETASRITRRMIIASDAWKLLFKKDFPEIYHPDMFSKRLINQETPPRYIKILNDMSKEGGRLGMESDTRPYWKLLYEYQLKNKFDTEMKFRNYNTTFYKHKYLELHIQEQKLVFFSFLGSNPITLSDSPISKRIKNIENGYIGILEMNENYIFIGFYISRSHQMIQVLSDMKGNIILERKSDPNERLRGKIGLIGAKGYFYQNKDNLEIVLSYNQIETTFNAIYIHECYNTRSECFILETIELGLEVYRFFEIRNDKPFFLGNITTDPKQFSSYSITYNNTYIVSVLSNPEDDDDNTHNIVVETLNSTVKLTEIENKPGDICIVGDYLYVFLNGFMRIYNLTKISGGKYQEYQSYRDGDYVHVRMSMMGPVFFGYDGNERYSLLLCSDSDTLKLVSDTVVCTQCGDYSPRYACGNRCGARYCGKKCQTKDWNKNNHYIACVEK